MAIQCENRARFFLLSTTLALLCFATTQSSSQCIQSCQGATPNQVPYPFGFSDSCRIRLNCTNDTILIDQFQVQNISSETILINLPEKCNRSIQQMAPLFGPNYWPTLGNGPVLQSRGARPKDCAALPPLIARQFGLLRCGRQNCFAEDAKGRDDFLMSSDNISRIGYDYLYSSVSLDPANWSSSVSLEFRTLQLGWWLEGSCSCDPNANRTNFATPGHRRQGCRCRCYDGFVGDGFRDGSGCRRASSNCNPTKCLSGRCGSAPKVGVLIGGIIAGAALVTGLALLCYIIRKRSNSAENRKNMNHLRR